MAALASTSYLAIKYRPIKVPVLPKPALQWTARALPFESSFSHKLMNYIAKAFEGLEPSGNSISTVFIL
jgi:hypothetical protein